MPCALTQGYNNDCRDSVGGVKEIYIIEVGNIGTITEASGVVTAIANGQGKRWFKYSLIRETSNADETITANEQNGTVYYAQAVNIILNKRAASVRNEIMLLAKNNLVIITVENTGKAWLYGRTTGLTLSGGNSGSGTAWADRNGSTLNFTGMEPEMAPEVQPSIIASLQTPGS